MAGHMHLLGVFWNATNSATCWDHCREMFLDSMCVPGLRGGGMNQLSSRGSLFLLHVCDVHSLTHRRLQTNIRDIPTPVLAR